MLKYWVVERISSLRLSLLKVEKSWATSSNFDGGMGLANQVIYDSCGCGELYVSLLNFSHVNGKRGVFKTPNSRYIELNELEILAFLLIQAQD